MPRITALQPVSHRLLLLFGSHVAILVHALLKVLLHQSWHTPTRLKAELRTNKLLMLE